MKKQTLFILGFGALLLFGLNLSGQPGGEKGDKGKGGKKGPPGFELGKVLPPFIREDLELTEDQLKQIADLEKEVRAKLQKILTQEQQQKIKEMGGKGPKGPPDGKGEKGPPDGKKKGKEDKEKLPDRPAMEEEAKEVHSSNLVKNPVFVSSAMKAGNPDHFILQGDAEWTHTGSKTEFSHRGIAFHSFKDLNQDGNHSGFVYQDVTQFSGGRGTWFRFSFRGLAENQFAVEQDGLFMKVDFFGPKGSLDGVTRKLFPLIEKDRAELAENGKFRKGGGAVWKTYQLDFMLPFAEINQLRLIVGFRNGSAKGEQQSQFYVSEFSLIPIPDPKIRPQVAKGPQGKTVAPADLISLGGRWYYLPEKPGEKTKPAELTIDYRNADRLFYLDHQLSNPFAENMSAWLLKGYKDRNGNLVSQNRLVPENIVIRFENDKTMIFQSRNLPNHPTSIFPAPYGSGDRNPNYIQEQAQTYYLPLNPVPNPSAKAMNKTNSNRALPMGPIGIATNGVVFFNPFDSDIQDATDLMDRCCGHPSPDNRYHYHKYPVCVKSPFMDEGEEHSPLIGFAFDGFPIYGPYESNRAMAKDFKENALNEFNVHYDEVRGWHYHVTPGRFPYIIGGYWGEVDSRNRGKKGPKK